MLRLLPLLALCAAPLTIASAAPQEWPFGTTPEDALGGNRDLYNLGLLGAKATDAIRGERRAGTGRQQVALEPESGPDSGPEKLKIECLFPEGPAAKAGLLVGDVVVGIGSKEFRDGCFEPLFEALLGAAAGKKPTEVVLRVEREGESKPLRIAVPLEPLEGLEGLGKKLSKPEARALLAGRALAWLADRQQEDGGFPQTLSGLNGALVQASMAGLAWIAGGSSLTEGPHAQNLARAVAFVSANVGAESAVPSSSDANWNQENWGWVHVGLFVGELYRSSPTEELKALLHRVAGALQKNQERSGGFAHGPGGPNGLGYVELNIVGGMALCALGLAQQAGCTLDEGSLERLIAYLEASSGDGVGYSTEQGQKGIGNIGRTAVTWLGYRALGRGKSRFASGLASYVKRNADQVLGGHASLMQHYLFAGLAATAQGGAAEKSYWATVERDLLLALAPDGSFQPRPWAESLAMGSNSDASFGEVWTTACWCCVLLGAPPKKGAGGLPALLGE